MDIRTIYKRVGLSNPEVGRKAEELLRRANIKGFGAGFPAAAVCKPAVCLEIACGILHVPVERASILKYSGVVEKEYLKILRYMRNSLGLRAAVDIKAMAAGFGCARITQSIERVLEEFKVRARDSIPSERRMHANFSSPAYAACAIYLTAKKHKMKIDRAKIIAASAITEEEFLEVHQNMHDLCYNMVGVGSSNKRAIQDSDGDSDGEEMQRKEQRTQEYENWKENVVANAKKTEQVRKVCSSSKQSRLCFAPPAKPQSKGDPATGRPDDSKN